LPDVYKKVANEEGPYQDKDGNRFEIQTCKITEGKEYEQVGTETIIDEDGNEQEVPVYDWVTVINRGWDNFESIEEAEKAYGLTKVEPEN
jgi:hypothetical protein